MSNSRFSRRDFLRMTAIGTAGVVLAGCAKATEVVPATSEVKPTAKAAAAKDSKITMMWRTNPDEEKMLAEWIPAFKAKTGIELVNTVVPWEEFEPKLMTLYASDIAPDVIGTGGTNPYVERWVRGMVLELDNYIMQEPASFTQDLYPVALNAYKKQGKTIAMTFTLCPAGTWINATRFDEAGVEYPSIDWFDEKAWTYEDFVAAAKKMTIDNEGDGKTDKFGGNWGHSGVWYNTRMWGQDLVAKEDYESGILHKIMASENSAVKEAMIASAQARADLVWKDKVSPDPETSQSLQQMGSLLKTGAIAMSMEGGWALWGDLPKEYKFRGAINFKGGVNGSGTRCNNTWAEPLQISSKTKNPDAAWAFVRWVSGDPEAIKVHGSHRNTIPASKGSFQGFVNSQKDRLAMSVDEISKFFAGCIEQANTTVPDHILVGWAKCRDVFNSNMEPVWLGEQKAAEAVEKVLPLAQAAIEANLKELDIQ
jgi:multiple sugar transport system substrate-binding protein